MDTEKISAIIVDDEVLAQKNIKNLIINYCQQVKLVGAFSDPHLALEFITKNNIDCIFLDINMPKMNGFKLLEEISEQDIEVIFVTGYSEYAIKALRANAVDYLLKPITISELTSAIERIEHKRTSQKNSQANTFKKLLNEISEQKSGTKITIPTTHGFKIISTSSIIRIYAEGPYSNIILQDSSNEIISKNLGYFQEILSEKNFYRIHRSHLINIDFLIEYSCLNGSSVIMADGYEIQISRRKVKEFKKKIHAISSH